MRKTSQAKLSKKKFIKAVENYREEIIDSYYSRHGDGDHLDEQKKMIIKLFKKSQISIKKELLYISLRTISRQIDEKRLDGYLNRLAHELDKKLNRIWQYAATSAQKRSSKDRLQQ